MRNLRGKDIAFVTAPFSGFGTSPGGASIDVVDEAGMQTLGEALQNDAMATYKDVDPHALAAPPARRVPQAARLRAWRVRARPRAATHDLVGHLLEDLRRAAVGVDDVGRRASPSGGRSAALPGGRAPTTAGDVRPAAELARLPQLGVGRARTRGRRTRGR